MPPLLQNVLVGLLVGAAFLYLAIRSWQWLRRKRAGGCGSGCHGCSDSTGQATPLITLEMKPPKDASS